MPKMSDLTKEKRNDRREARKTAPCPHDWVDADGFASCRICGAKAVAVVVTPDRIAHARSVLLGNGR